VKDTFHVDLGETMVEREKKKYWNVEGRMPERMCGSEGMDHQRSGRSPVKKGLGFRSPEPIWYDH
jgi:hypothetical protein